MEDADRNREAVQAIGQALDSISTLALAMQEHGRTPKPELLSPMVQLIGQTMTLDQVVQLERMATAAKDSLEAEDVQAFAEASSFVGNA